jgi:acyl carrier protein
VITHAYEQFGTIHGVIHSAGIVGEQSKRTIPETDDHEYERQFRAKVQGVYILERVLHGRSLDFCILQSSLSSILGGLAFSAYAAANLFMDAFAHQYHQPNRVPWISVNWDAWRFEAENERQTAMGATLARLAMTPEEGMEAFQRVLSLDAVTQIVVSTADLHTRIDQWIKLIPLQQTKNLTTIGSSSEYPTPHVQKVYTAPTTELEQAIADVWREVLGIEHVGIHDNFLHLGGHSLMALQVLTRLRRALQVEVSVRALFEAPTVAGLAKAIEQTRLRKETKGDQDLAQILAEIERLSDDQVEKKLHEKI